MFSNIWLYNLEFVKQWRRAICIDLNILHVFSPVISEAPIVKQKEENNSGLSFDNKCGISSHECRVLGNRYRQESALQMGGSSKNSLPEISN